MTDVIVPPIPLSLQHLPTMGGLVVPWITPRTTDGRYLFGSIDRDRMGRALLNRWCGVCGRPLEDRAKQEELHLMQHSSTRTERRLGWFTSCGQSKQYDQARG